jgi:hypothetical protein
MKTPENGRLIDFISGQFPSWRLFLRDKPKSLVTFFADQPAETQVLEQSAGPISILGAKRRFAARRFAARRFAARRFAARQFGAAEGPTLDLLERRAQIGDEVIGVLDSD